MTVLNSPVKPLAQMGAAERAAYLALTEDRETILDTQGIATRFDVKKNTVDNWKMSPDDDTLHPSFLPPPDVRVGGSPGWRAGTTLVWGEQTGKLKFRKITKAVREAFPNIEFRPDYDFVPQRRAGRLQSPGKPRRHPARAA